MIISQETLADITGYSRTPEIAACLTRQGIRYLQGKRGRIFTTIEALNHAMGATELHRQVTTANQEIEF
ncbi:DUF4224 domain-containing protein [Desulfogranum marinum]|uniref:DUF4224 domain-containing protein n=1 Tax=Desulfogranum marinum TaxID=453220 RepID=UPI00374CC518